VTAHSPQKFLVPARLWVTCSQAVARGFDVLALIENMPRQTIVDSFSVAVRDK